MRLAFLLGVLTACSFAGGDAVAPDAADVTPDGAVDPDAPLADECSDITEATAATVMAPASDELVLSLIGQASTATSWAVPGNEAVILEVSSSAGLVGHLILHQGAHGYPYSMHVGAHATGDMLTIRVSSLTAPNAARAATVCGITLTPVASLENAEGIVNAPIYRWPVQKRFDDVPLVIGWSKGRKSYQTAMTNENGGTAELCGGGPSGMQAEIARWGRSTDIEGHYSYGGAAPQWSRCTGRVATTVTPVRTEALHPILYYGDGHNRLFESRGGYGQTCGTNSPERADGNLTGWNTSNTSNALAADDGNVIVLRPVPVDMDALGTMTGRREALADRYAPWLYRLASQELQRENKIDDSKTFVMQRYLYVDVRVSDVGGAGDSYCTPTVTGGFVLRAVTTNGESIVSPQITTDYASSGNHDWKRVAMVMPIGTKASDIDHFVFDAYDGDGIYVTAIGDAFVPVDDGNGAKIDYVRMGTKALALYVDDDKSGCSANVNTGGPNGSPYTCVGSYATIAK